MHSDSASSHGSHCPMSSHCNSISVLPMLNKDGLITCKLTLGVIARKPDNIGVHTPSVQVTVIVGLRSFAQASKSNIKVGATPEIWHGILTLQKANDAGPVTGIGVAIAVL